MLKSGTFTNRKFRMMFIAALLGWVVSLLGGMADSIIAGMFLDAEAVSAVGLISPIESVVYFLSLAIGAGTAIIYSRTLGSFDVEKSKKIAGMGLIASVSLAAVVGIVLAVLRKQLIGFYGVSDSIYNYADLYYTPLIFVSVLYPLLWTIYYMVSYDGDEKLVLLCDIITAVSNAVLSFALVKKMGIAGLGWGTFISDVLGLLCILPHFFRKGNSIKFRPYFSFRDLGSMLKVSSALSLTTLYMGIIDILFNKLVIVFFDETYLTAYAVINVVMNFAAALACAIGAGTMFVSVAYGENNSFALKRVMRHTNIYAFFTSVALTLVLEALATAWPKLYGIEIPEVYDAAVYAGRIVPLFFIAAAFVYTYLTYYPSVGRTIEGNILVLCYMLIGPVVICIPLAKVSFNAMSLGFGITPVFAIVIMVLYVLITGRIRQFPYLVDETEAVEAHFDLMFEPESIIEVRDKVGDFLKEQNIDETTVNKVRVTLEDTLVFISRKNSKKIMGEITVLVSDKYIRMISKDNGMIFDITKEADDAVDFRAYVLARMMQDAKEASNSTTISFNRNVCVWER